LNEAEIIRRIAARGSRERADVVLGIGDDAAILRVPAGHELVVSTDRVVEGVHFPPHMDPWSVGHKALAVNLSDLAAMGAEPAWFTLNLAMPKADEIWLNTFCDGLFAMADAFGVALVGGDTDRAPLSVGIQIMGFVPRGRGIRRKGANAGDVIYVTGTLGDAMLGLEISRGALKTTNAGRDQLLARFERPTPRIAVGLGLRGIATACIDVSDGLAADLGRILEASGVGATVMIENVPFSDYFRRCAPPHALARSLTHGEDYELAFTAPESRHHDIEKLAARSGCALTPIGRVEPRRGLRVVDEAGRPIKLARAGYDHFAQ
jgi:thiamine-monophosphate kinase